MSFNILYSPWRSKYVTNSKRSKSCVFCDYVKDGFIDDDILYHNDKFFVVMNKYPYNNGHILLVPNAHVSNIEEIDDDVWSKMSILSKRAIPLIMQEYKASGVNMGLNLGSSAGAGIASHIHQHILPRWSGDSNFMTTVGDTRVYCEVYEESRDKLKRVFNKLK